jgi:hypothetical protein
MLSSVNQRFDKRKRRHKNHITWHNLAYRGRERDQERMGKRSHVGILAPAVLDAA